MEVNVDIDVNDLIATNDHLMRKLPALRRRTRILQLVFSFIFLVPGVIIFLVRGDVFSGYIYIGGAVFFLLFIPSLIRWSMKRQLRSMYCSSQNRGVFGKQKIVINKSEIARYSQYGHTAFYWPAVERVEVGSNHAFVFVSSVNAFIIPKRDFPSENEFDLFVENARMYHREAE